jgi:periplasmic divalent cation tolerance protein
MPEELLVVMSTWPDAETASAACRLLVEEQLIACANIVPNVQSIYRWDGRIETGAELLVFMKTTAANYAALERRIAELHPFEVPEILGLALQKGLPRYWAWVAESCHAVREPKKAIDAGD